MTRRVTPIVFTISVIAFTIASISSRLKVDLSRPSQENRTSISKKYGLTYEKKIGLLIALSLSLTSIALLLIGVLLIGTTEAIEKLLQKSDYSTCSFIR